MSDYEPLDLETLTNAGLDILVEGPSAPTGAQRFHGLPFQVGSPHGNCFIALGGDRGTTAVEIPVGKTARHVIVAHRLLQSQILESGPIGNAVAEYVFHLTGQEPVRVPIRERFEIATVPNAGGAPFDAFPDQKDGLQPRYEGPWEQAGRRQMESSRGTSRGYVLWDWENPIPDAVIEKLEVVPAGPGFVIAALTLGHLNEHPFSVDAPGEIIITLPQTEDADASFDLEVDRGIATYPYPLPRSSSEEFVKAPEKGWGQQRNDRNSPAYVEVAATPSATVKVKTSEKELAR